MDGCCPPGPLREPVAAAASRCQAAVLIGADDTQAVARLPPDLPVLRAELVQDASIAALAGRAVVAFAGIALPEKFFAPLRRAGAIVVAARPFADHHRLYGARAGGVVAARRANGVLSWSTTPKDAVRLPPALRAQVRVIGVGLLWREPEKIDQFLARVITSSS